MPLYRIFRMKEVPRQQFRWAPHTSGVSMLKPKDYEQNGEVEASGVYDAWTVLRATDTPLRVGDLLENPGGDLRIYKYVGFEEAKWVLPEVKSGLESAPLAAGGPSGIGPVPSTI